jgi:hypothetical protein
MKRMDIKTNPAAARKTKFYTARGANKSLVLVSRIVSDAVKEYNHLLEQQELAEIAQLRGSDEYCGRLKQDMGKMFRRLQGYVCELEQLGVELRDFERGQVDFPAIRNGRGIRLCWEMGQESVSSWYEPDLGFSARRPISELAHKPPLAVHTD